MSPTTPSTRWLFHLRDFRHANHAALASSAARQSDEHLPTAFAGLPQRQLHALVFMHISPLFPVGPPPGVFSSNPGWGSTRPDAKSCSPDQ